MTQKLSKTVLDLQGLLKKFPQAELMSLHSLMGFFRVCSDGRNPNTLGELFAHLYECLECHDAFKIHEESLKACKDAVDFTRRHPEVELIPLVTAYYLCCDETPLSLESAYKHVLECEYCQLFLSEDNTRKINGLPRINIMQLLHDKREEDR